MNRKPIVVAFNILAAIALTASGAALSYLSLDWIGSETTMWVCTLFFLFGLIVGMRNTVIEALVVGAIVVGIGYLIINNLPMLLPIYGGFAGLLLYFTIVAVYFSQEEALMREVTLREWKEQELKQRVAERIQELQWEEKRKRFASLPILTHDVDIKKCLESLRSHLNASWAELPAELFSTNHLEYKLIHTWLQRQFNKLVERPIGCPIMQHYGEYDPEFDDELPERDVSIPSEPTYRPMKIWVNSKFEFSSLVSIGNEWDYTRPPFDYVLAYEVSGPNEGTEHYIAFSEVEFELRPVEFF